MLTGTLVTIAGFVPVGFAQSGAGEYCFSLFAVVGIALARLLGRRRAVHAADRRRHPARQARRATAGHAHPRASRAGSATASIWRCAASWLVLGASAGLFAASLVGMQFVQQQFFPKSDRPEVMVDLTLPQDASLKATQETVDAGREAADGRSRRRALELLRRAGRRPLLSAARRRSSRTTSSPRPSSSPRATRCAATSSPGWRRRLPPTSTR